MLEMRVPSEKIRMLFLQVLLFSLELLPTRAYSNTWLTSSVSCFRGECFLRWMNRVELGG